MQSRGTPYITSPITGSRAATDPLSISLLAGEVAATQVLCRLSSRLSPTAAFLPHRDPELHVRVPDIPLELILIGLAQDGLLVGLR